MNMLQTISNTNNDEQTMGTLEIAKMLEKQHAHIRTSAERLVQSGAINGGIALRDTPPTSTNRTNRFIMNTV